MPNYVKVRYMVLWLLFDYITGTRSYAIWSSLQLEFSLFVHLSSKSMTRQPGLNNLITSRRIIMRCQTMRGLGLDIRLKLTHAWELLLALGGDRCCISTCSQAISTAERLVVLAREHEDRPLERRSQGRVANGEDLADGDGLLSHFGNDAEADVVVAWEEEDVLSCGKVGGDEVAGGVVEGCEAGLVVTGNEVTDFGSGDFIPNFLGRELDADALKHGLNALN